MVISLQNKHWQVGILPQTGGSTAFGRIRYSGAWVDVMRPTSPVDYDNPSNCSNFLMLPWANRIRDGVLRHEGETWQLRTDPDGNIRHGDVRKRAWQITEQSETALTVALRSQDFPDFNYPFAFSATLTYQLDDSDFVWSVTLNNEDERAFPFGIGFHPYFQRLSPTMPMLEVPCDRYFVLQDALPDQAPIAIPPDLDFRSLRAVPDDITFDHLLANRDTTKAIRLVYSDWDIELQMHVDDVYEHVILYSAPDGSMAVEPQSNANDGFTLRERGIDNGGVQVIEAGASREMTVRLRITSYSASTDKQR
ncbi:MAG: aldose 1-epimerase [Anaerolineae bacterium]